MFQFLKILWYFIGFFVILIIMIQNPKAEGAGLSNQIIVSDSDIKKKLLQLTWFLIILFLILTSILAQSSVLY
uniref:Probable protein-export membrane protein SecG n=1 Tax=Rhodochaete parvula TaxID=110510 RepID=A0A1X9PUT1_9RHOD|nr:preprotein translocase SecG subunit [Rhodochaete parvula]